MRPRFAVLMERARARRRRAKPATEQVLQQQQEPDESPNDDLNGGQLAEADSLARLRAHESEKLYLD